MRLKTIIIMSNAKKIKATIETGNDNTFNVYVEQAGPFGFFGEGETVEQAKQDFINSYNEMKGLYKKKPIKR